MVGFLQICSALVLKPHVVKCLETALVASCMVLQNGRVSMLLVVVGE